MEQWFSDIVDTGFTAQMEGMLDTVEEGKKAWKDILRDFYDLFSDEVKAAEDSGRVKVEDEVSEEKCDVCGRNMVVKSGRFGRFLACPGYPECTFTKPLVVEMPGRCPRCGGRLMKRSGVSKKSGKQYTYYACEFRGSRDESKACDFTTFDVPVKDDCPSCGQTMFKKSGKGYKRPYCINPACERFVPEEKRGYTKKTAAEASAEKPAAKKAAGKKTAAAKKAAPRKSAAKKQAAPKAVDVSADEFEG